MDKELTFYAVHNHIYLNMYPLKNLIVGGILFTRCLRSVVNNNNNNNTKIIIKTDEPGPNWDVIVTLGVDKEDQEVEVVRTPKNETNKEVRTSHRRRKGSVPEYTIPTQGEYEG